MPFDGNPEQFTKPDVFSLDSLIAWLRTQPGETFYDWHSNDCLLCRYLIAQGVEPGRPNDTGSRTYGRMAVATESLATPFYGKTTYAAALSRALALRDKLNEATEATIPQAAE